MSDQTRSTWRWTTLLVSAMALARPATAHPPYEHPDRVIKDASGRSLHLMKSYVDGIFFTDPVKLVVRDEDDRTVAETEYTRDVTVVCLPAACTVFQYDGLMPVFPQHVWQLQGRQLVPARSPRLIALGVVAPLWDHGAGYILSVLLLALPFAVLWLLSRAPSGSGRSVLIGLVAFGAVLYTIIWLYTVVLLSYLSLPLVAVVGVAFVGVLHGIRRGGPRFGISAGAIQKGARVSVRILVALGGVVVVVVVGLLGWMIVYSTSIHFDEPPVQHPLATARVTRARGAVKEVFATLASGVRLEDVVNLRLFDGFEPGMTREDAERRLGVPSGRWSDPTHHVQAIYYDRPSGRVSLARLGASEWWVIGYPTTCTHDYVFTDKQLRDQVLAWVPPDKSVQVNVLRSVGWGGLTAYLNRKGCTHLVLTARETDPVSGPAVRPGFSARP